MKALKWIFIIAVLIAIDQVTKYLTEAHLPLQQVVELVPTLSLYRTYNYGIAFSLFSGLNGWPLNLLTFAIIGFVFWLWRGLEPGRWLSSAGFALIIGGALGNVIDRVRIGKVVDMILFHIESLNFSFAVFNVADTFITVGAGIIILDEIINWRSKNSTTGQS